jgi:hypothetical protein
MEFFVHYWFILVGATLGIGWVILFLNRHRIESPWLRYMLGLSLEDPLLKAGGCRRATTGFGAQTYDTGGPWQWPVFSSPRE